MSASVHSLYRVIESGNPDDLTNAVYVDYGFQNAVNNFRKLVLLYRVLVAQPEVTRADLHSACIKGELALYIKKMCTGVSASILDWFGQNQHIVDNPYPCFKHECDSDDSDDSD